MNWLSTTIAAVMAILAAYCAWVAVRAHDRARDQADSAEDHARSIARDAKKIAALHDELESVHGRLNRLAGRVYASSRKPPAEANGDDGPGVFPGNQQLAELDPELAAELALQTAPPVSPGKRS